MPNVFLSAFLLWIAYPNDFVLYGIWPLAWIAIAPFFYALSGRSFLVRFFYGTVFGICFYAVLVRWFFGYNSLGYSLFVFLLALQPLLFAVFYKDDFKLRILNYIYVPALWVVTEVFRSHTMQGFSWDLAHSQSFNLPVLQSVSVFGSKGLSFLLVLVNNSICLFFKEKSERKRAAFLILAVFIAIYGFGFYRLKFKTNDRAVSSTGRRLEIMSVQPNIDPRVKIDDSRVEEMVAKQVNMTMGSGFLKMTDLIIWPETAVPVDIYADPKVNETLRRLANHAESHFLLGSAMIIDGGLYNSAVFWGKRGDHLGSYHKRHLIPFSEYLPDGEFWWKIKQWMRIDNYDFVTKDSSEPLVLQIEQEDGAKMSFRFGVLICSEDTIGRAFREYKRKKVDFVVILLNDAWFEKETALILHAQNAIVHAVENDLPVLRVANSGWSCLIDGFGRISPGARQFNEEAVFQHGLFLEN